MQAHSRKLFTSLFSTFVAASIATVAQADIITLNSGNSSATVDLSSQAGMGNWLINGQNQLNQQWFWYRVDGDTSQHSIDTIGGLSYLTNANQVFATYTAANFTLEVDYTLTGGSSGGSDWTSDITENISIHNLTGTTNSFHFYQYSDFALGGTFGGESAAIFQNGSFFSKANVTKASSQLSETIDQPLANEAEADIGTATLNRLNSVSSYNLNNVLNSGPDDTRDATWALQWDFSIAPDGTPGDTVDVIKDKKLSVAPVPEPTALSLLGLGAVAFILRRKRSLA